MIVYWSPWCPTEVYPGYQLAFDEPVPLLSTIKDRINQDNMRDNFFKCPAFLDTVKNIYCLNTPWDMDVEFHPNGTVIDHSEKKSANLSQMYQIKNPSMTGANTVNVFANWVFYSEESLVMQTTPPYMHKSSLAETGFYVPGSFDISQWFRPVEGALQLWPGAASIKSPVGDPFIYVQFLTDEPIEFRRFYMTKEILEISQNCTRFKQFKTIKKLDKLYDIFVNRGMKTRLTEHIKKNLV